MGKAALLIDFGASRIKACLCKNKKPEDEKCFDSIMPNIIDDFKFEVSATEIKNKFLEIVKMFSKTEKISAIYLCSEMHGFVLVDSNDNALSDYISWKDERAQAFENKTKIYDELIKKKGKQFFEKTGMKPKSCYPVFKVEALAKEKRITSAKVISLPEWLCCVSGKSTHLTNVTMSAAMGFYNINQKCHDKELCHFENLKLDFNKTVYDVEIGGYLTIDSEDIPIYTGVGDLQAAIFGLSYSDDTININMGTGSQVITLGVKNENLDTRPFFNNKVLNVITHIPSGRALNTYLGFLSTINPKLDYWKLIKSLKLSDLKKSSLNINLAIFSSAKDYQDGGFISNIKESNFDLNNYLSSLINSYLCQYQSAIEELMQNHEFDRIVLSGGISSKLPVIKEYFQDLYKKEVIVSNSQIDDTLIGLSRLVKEV